MGQIEEADEQLFVFYPNEDVVVVYEYEEVKPYLMLSYALTIHKVQGMEYDIVVIPMTFSHFIMHNTKLIYTAITRAKEQLIFSCKKSTFESKMDKLLCLFRWLAWTLDACLELSRIIGTLMLACHWNA